MQNAHSKTDRRAVIANRVQGQAIVEYAIMISMFLGVTLILILLMSVFSEYGWRMISLVSLDL